MEGWGGHCRLPGPTTAHYSGLWLKAECRLHINVLELRAVRLMLLHLEQELLGQSVLIESDNTATVSYINKQGVVVAKTVNDKVCPLNEWVIPRSLNLQAIHRPDVNNELADYLWRNRPSPTEWHLIPLMAQYLFQVWGRLQVDLFASYLNHQLPLWFCQTVHPLVAASNALSQSWTVLSLYTYPPIPLLERTLIKIREDQAEEAIVITPCWPRRSWYHLLHQMMCEIPLLLSHKRDLLSQCLTNKGMLYHTDLETLQLTACKLSGIPSRTKAFLRQLSAQSSLPPMTPLSRCTTADGRASLAGVVKEVRIPLAPL